ncbi:MAG: DUF2142 domain-containing protein [Anaerolineae bacterium]
MPVTSLERLIYSAILSTFLLLGALFAWRVPDWQAPDEPAHYNYIAQVVAGDPLPIIEMGDWDNAYLETLKANDFAPQYLDDLDQVQYEDHQPPLYYWLASPIFGLSGGDLFAVRMVSVALGALIIALSYAITLAIVPERRHLALAVMALVAFLPQNLHILASVNNDALAGVVIAVLIGLCVRYLQGTNDSPVWLGVGVGVAFLTKTTIYFMAGVVLIVIAMRWWRTTERDLLTLAWHYVRFGIPSGLIALFYWGRNLLTYGFPDFLGLQAHDAVVVGQPRRADFIAENGIVIYWRDALLTSFHSFWGQFGWMEARLADALPGVFALIVALVIVALAGLVMRAVRPPGDPLPSQVRVLLALVIAFALAQYVYYNLTFVQFQGRYLFVALIPTALGLVLGLDQWRVLLFDNARWGRWALLVPFGALAVLNLYLIWRVLPCALGC